MDYELLRLACELLVSGFAAILWWNFRGLAGEVAVSKKELVELRLLIATDYVRHSDIDKLIGKIDDLSDRFDSKFERVFNLIGRKADRP